MHVTGWREGVRSTETKDSERSKLRARLRGGRAQRESQVDPSTQWSQHPQETGRSQSAKTNRPAPKRPSTLTSEPLWPSPGSARSSPRGNTGPPHATSSSARSSRGPSTPGAGKARRDQVSEQRRELGGGCGRGPALVYPSGARGPDLAGAAVALLALLHEAVPAACPAHQEPGVRCVG